jgi:excisionase family DNA binding protein
MKVFQMKEPQHDLITVRQAARLRGVTPRAIYELIQRGRLIAVERYGLTLVHKKEVESFEPLPPGRKTTGK